MKSLGKVLGSILVILFFLCVSSGFAGDLPKLKQLNCGDHACLCKSNKSKSPPNKRCWGWYDSHTYNLLKLIGHPLKGAEIAGFVTGGPSEKNKMVRGFKLQVLPSSTSKKGQLRKMKAGNTCDILCRVSGWKTLKTFAAPCASGPKELINWEGHLQDVIALRIVAPKGCAVDNSKIWIEY